MITFPTNYLVLEGSDLSGKGTLYRGVHRESGYRWNIQDRSFLSMLVYAKMYGRETGLHARGLWGELTNLNNRMVLLLPTRQAILDRYSVRGDDIQDEVSLQRVVDLFDDHDWLGDFPNVMVLDNSEIGREALDESVTTVVGWTKTKEEFSLDDISAEVLGFVSAMPTGAADDMRGYESKISFTLYDDLGFEEADPDVMDDPEEGKYYLGIFDELTAKIERELAGDNEYGEPQTASSRRFVYTSDTCISFIQILVRDGLLDMHVVLRSTNALKTFSKDLRFLYYLLFRVCIDYGELGPVRAASLRVQLNSAHLVR